MSHEEASPRPPRRARPESFRALDLSVSLTVEDLPASVEWYRNVLGFTVDQEHVRDGVLRAVSLKAGNAGLVLSQDDGSKGHDRVKGEGFSLYFPTKQSVDWIADRIRERGGSLTSGPSDTPWGARVIRLHDPDGFLLVIATDPNG